ncbi:uncharacterized protein LOC115923643 [Strongylocentrotus purpuratus]|uniref:Uncharacterized protein n=1 Tax=Strongylocentrotus purpuratus TaxID=7668 RepID=A0A7M7NRY2_STRPU|nr:uncharacterized protein LOC115923643 [Strongylocentrotus purpuratus]
MEVHQQEGETEGHQQEGQTQGHEQERRTLGHQQGEDIHIYQRGKTQVQQQEGETLGHQQGGDTHVHQKGVTEDHQQERGTQIHQQGETQVHQKGVTEDHQQERGTQIHQQGETQVHQQERETLGHQQGGDTHVHQQGETHVHQQGGDTHVHQQEGETEGHQHERETQVNQQEIGTLGHQQERGTQIHQHRETQQERGTLGHQQEGEMQINQQEGQTQGHEQERGTIGHQQGGDIHFHQQEGETQVHQQERGTPGLQQGETQGHQPVEGEFKGLEQSEHPQNCVSPSSCSSDEEEQYTRPRRFIYPNLSKSSSELQNHFDSDESDLDPTYRPEEGSNEEYSSDDEATLEIHPRNVQVRKRPSSVISTPDEKPTKIYKQCLPGSFSGPELPHQKTNDNMETTHKHEDKKTRYKKPSRPCPFCNKACGEKLSRHICLVHKDKEQVKSAMQLPKRERDKVFSKFRKEGIYQVNRERMKDDNPIYEREKLPKSGNDDNLKMCSNCKGFYSSHFFWHHRKVCQGDICTPSEGVPVNLMEGKDPVYQKHPDFVTDILSRFQNDDVGNTCRTDKVIVNVGHRLWTKHRSKKDKKLEVRKSVMADMRRLATLYTEFKKKHEVHGTADLTMGHAGDMFSREHFESLTEAIQTLTYDETEGKLKPGLKLCLYFVLKKASKITKASFLVSRLDEDASEIDKFVEILDLNQNLIFGDAHYEIQKNRQVRLRKPAELPLEADIEALKTYTQKKVTEIISDEFLVWDSHTFVELRDLTCSRLTLWNARRGGEPSRLTTEEWRDAEEGVWMQKDKIHEVKNPAHQELLSQLKICYQTGKGTNRLVPVLFPRDTVKPVQLLCDQEIRHTAGIRPDNKYIFACTQMSHDHVGGWHALKNVSDNISLSSNVTVNATKNRHRVSTIYASLDLPDADLELFYRHMGHSSTINQTIYQTPLAIQEITRVGSHLHHIDIGGMRARKESEASDDDGCSSAPATSKDGCSTARVNSKHDDSTLTVTSEDGSSTTPATSKDGCSTARVNSEHGNSTLTVTSEDGSSTTPATSKDGCSTATLTSGDRSSARRYNRWSKQGSKQCKQYFSAAIKQGEPLPGRKACTTFLQRHQITMEWQAVRNKVMNERNKAKKNFDDRERSFLN